MPPDKPPATFAEKVHQFITDAYDYSELDRVMHYRLDQKLGQIASDRDGFDTVVFKLVLWADRNGRLAALAHAVAEERSAKDGAAELLQSNRAAPNSAGRATVPSRNDDTTDAEVTALPSTLPPLIRAYERIRLVMKRSKERSEMMFSLVDEMLALPLEQLSLPEKLHLSGSPGERLVAAIALQKKPDPRFLRWLSERLVVESRFVGYAACQALVEAAKRLRIKHLDQLGQALSDCEAWLQDLSDYDGHEELVAEARAAIEQRLEAKRR